MSTLQGIETVAFKKCFHTRICRLVVYSDLVVIYVGTYFVGEKLIRLGWRKVNFLKNSLILALGMTNINLLVMLYTNLTFFFFPTQMNLFHF